MRRELTAGLVIVLGLAGAAQTPGGVPLLADDPLTALRVSSSRGRSEVVSAEGPGFTRAIRVTVGQPGQPWDVELRASLARPVEQQDVGLIAFHARAVQSSDETGEVHFTVYAQKASPEWDKSMHATLAVGPGWQRFAFPFRWIASYESGRAIVAFGMGGRAQAVEVGGIEIAGFGRDYPIETLPTTRFSYGGREPDAAWRRDAARRIDAIRKGDLVVAVVDRDGRPIDGAEVRLELRRHAFPFGSAVAARQLLAASPDGEAYRRTIEELFSSATLENDLKWPPWEGDWGADFNVPQTLAALEWLKARRMSVRGHVLVWPGWSNLPRSITALRGRPDAATLIPPMVLAHIDDATRRTAAFVEEWDVINEPYANHDLMDLAGPEIMRAWFQQARRNLPEAPLYLNDYGILSAHGADTAHQDHFEQTARFLLDGGAPLTGLGMQGHFGASPTSIETVKRVLDRFAALGLSIRITEFDVDTDDEQLQADYTRDFLTMVFSHPAVAGFQMWGFWEGAHWRGRAAMFRRDWTEKPNGAAFRRLVNDEWRTRGDGRTDTDGRFGGPAFFGAYDVTVTIGSRSRGVRLEHRRGEGPTIVRVEM